MSTNVQIIKHCHNCDMETLNTHVYLHSLNLSNVCHKCVNNTQILLSELYIKITEKSKNIYYLLRSVWPVPRQLLCVWHLLKAHWLWVWQAFVGDDGSVQ